MDLNCTGAGPHTPAPRSVEQHHVFPKYLAGLLGVPVVRVLTPVCGTCHNNIHREIDDLVTNGPRRNRHRLPVESWELAVRAYEWWHSALAGRP